MKVLYEPGEIASREKLHRVIEEILGWKEKKTNEHV